jgi:PAS domain S-box-containing protein
MELLTYNGSRQSHKAMSVNLHYRGAEIVTDAELQKGTTVTLRLSKIPGNPQTDSTQGIIRWAYNAPNRYKYGIAFRQDCRWFFLLTQQQLLNVQKDDSSLASSVLNALDQGVLSVNKHWQITLFNKAAEHITGWQQDEVLGKKCYAFFSPDLCNDCFLTEDFSKGIPVVKQTLFATTRQGHRILLKISSTPLLRHDRTVDGIVQIFSPVSRKESLSQSRPQPLQVIDKQQATLCIQTLGKFAMRINRRPFYDRMWKGRRSKELLKTIIALGGTKISMERLADLLWPDSDGDRALNNLKMALSRLRRIGGAEYLLPANWLVVKHKSVSLTRDICRVDALDFKSRLKKCRVIQDHQSLQETLLLYTSDFLPQDDAPWIISLREHLRTLFIEGVLHLASLADTDKEALIALLEQACHCAPLHEEIYACLMQLYLQAGFPITALEIYKRSKKLIFNSTGVFPGVTLQLLAKQAASAAC